MSFGYFVFDKLAKGASITSNLSKKILINGWPEIALRGMSSTTSEDPTQDKLFKAIQIEVRGHDREVLRSYMIFLRNACHHLEIEYGKVVSPRYVWWQQYALRAKFAKKKYKLHYETRTNICTMPVFHLTGSTASTFLEYAQRNIPEGVAMKVAYKEIAFLPESIREQIEKTSAEASEEKSDIRQ